MTKYYHHFRNFFGRLILFYYSSTHVRKKWKFVFCLLNKQIDCCVYFDNCTPACMKVWNGNGIVTDEIILNRINVILSGSYSLKKNRVRLYISDSSLLLDLFALSHLLSSGSCPSECMMLLLVVGIKMMQYSSLRCS